MSKRSILYVVVATMILMGGGMDSLAAANKGQPPRTYTGFVSDDGLYMVRSDGRGLYVNDEDCVAVLRMAGGGWFMLRTVHNIDPCNGELSYWSPNPYNLPTHRYLTLDFGNSTPGDLDGNGTAEAIEKAPARIQFADAFAQGATSTYVGIAVLHVNSDGTTTQDTAWSITYHNAAHVRSTAADAVDLYLEPGEAAADLCEVVQTVNPKNGRVKTSCEPRGTFDLPFHVQATPVQ